jgi:hypothetical protein
VLAPGTLAGADELQEALDRGRFTQREVSALTELIRAAERDGVPGAMLAPRIEEAVSKRVPFVRLMDALHHDVMLLNEARAILTSIEGGSVIVSDPASWSRAANMLAAGYGEESLVVIGEACVPEPDAFRPATALFASVVDWGLEVDPALELTVAAVHSELRTDDFPEIGQLLSDSARARLPATEAADRIAAHLDDGRTIRQIERLLFR